MNNKKQLEICNILQWRDKGYTGKGIKIGFIDDLPGFRDRPFIKIPFDITRDYFTHGDKTMDVCHQVAPDITIYALPNGTTWESWNGEYTVDWILKQGISIINVSMTGSSFTDEEINRLFDAGVIIVGAAGNEAKEGECAWLSDDRIIAVGAVHLNDDNSIEIADYSSRGLNYVDCVGFSHLKLSEYFDDSNDKINGTSYSCPWVSGMIAIYQQYYREKYNKLPNYKEVQKFIYSNCVDLGDAGKDSIYGHGLFKFPTLEDKNDDTKENVKKDEVIYSVQINGDGNLFKELDKMKAKYTTFFYDGFNLSIAEMDKFEKLNDAINLKIEYVKKGFDVEIVKYINGNEDKTFNENENISNSDDPRDFLLSDHPILENSDDDLYNKDYDLRNKFMPKVFDQIGGSCTAQATIASYWYQMNLLYDKLGAENDTEYSRAYTYLMTRYLNGGVKIEGGNIRDACKSIKKYGVADERHFPSDSDFEALPDFYTMAYAANDKIDSYYALSEKDDYLFQILVCLNNNIPVIVGMNTNMFRDAKENGISEKALEWDERMEPNHALLIVGRICDFDYLGKKQNVFIIRNSWGEDWGDNGYFYIPEDKLVKYGISDVMVIVKDNFGCDEPINNFILKKSGKKNAIPNNTLIYENNAYSLKYLYDLRDKDYDKFHKIYDPILKNYKNVYIKKNNKILDVDSNEKDIEFPLTYTGNNGEIYIIE